LQVDVEAVAVGRPLGQQRRAPLLGHRAQDDVLDIGLGLVGEVDPGDHAVQQPLGEDRDVDVRSLQAALAVRHPPRLQRADRELAGLHQ
jgi:hypothetical protein